MKKTRKSYKQQVISNKKKWCSDKAFTLIELLVVVTIIMILSVIGAVNYKEMVKKSRDTRRQSDLEQIRGALELYRADADVYPALPNCGLSLTYNGTEYINKIPCDPSSGDSYGYELDGTLKYTLGAVFEITTGSPVLCGTLSCTSATCNYCIANP